MKTAVTMLIMGCDAAQAQDKLSGAGGKIKEALKENRNRIG